MDINILLALQDFRNGTGMCLASFFEKMTWLGKMNAATVFGGGAVRKDLLVACIGSGLAIVVAIYASVKPYPVDLDAAGNVLVEGAKMANDTFKGIGYCVAFLTGWILGRRFVQFSTEISMMKRMIRLTVGLLSYYVVSLIFAPVIKEWIIGAPGTFLSCYLVNCP